MSINYRLTRYKTHISKALMIVAIAFSPVASPAAEAIQLRELASADVEHFLAGRGSNQCTARLWSESGQLIGVIQERNSLLVQFPTEVQGLILEKPRYFKNGASYTVTGQSDFGQSGINSQGALEITTLPRSASAGSVYSYSAVLSLRQIGSSTTTTLHVRLEDSCGAKSRLAYGPGGIEKLIRIISR